MKFPKASHAFAIAVFVGCLGLAACSTSGDDASSDSGDQSNSPAEQEALGGDELRLNEIQMLGSHNSYHLAAEPNVAAALQGFVPDLYKEIDYSHLPLSEQLEDYGIRQFEIDVFADPEGGEYSTPAALDLIDAPIPPEDAMESPGFKVQHIADIDYNTTCTVFVECLEEVQTWSAANPNHLPVMIMVETKGDDLRNGAGDFGVDIDTLGVEFAVPPEMTPELYDDLEAEVLSVFSEDQIITPDDVRGDRSTLEEAVLEDGWPTVGESRGKVIFSLVDTGDAREIYVEDAPALEDKLFFTSSEPGRPDAAFIRVDNSLDDTDKLQEYSEAGYLIRTRTDEPGVHALDNDITLRDSALASGGNYLSTDQYVAYPDTGFVVALPGGSVAVCNPVSAPRSCSTIEIVE